MMKRISLSLFVLATAFAVATADAADEAVFSGPQVGEKLSPLRLKGVYDDLDGKEFDLVQQADGGAIALVFVHDVTRPSIALTRAVLNYAGSRSGDGLTAGLIMLNDDLTAAEAQLRRARHAMPASVPVGISLDGGEGPGAYGLNRKVTLTVLVAKDNKVTANFAIIQPSVQADARKITKAIVDALGGGHTPTLADLGVAQYGKPQPRMRQEAKLRPLLTPLIAKGATPQQVDQAAAALEAYVAKNQAARKELGQIARRIIDAGKLANYGTPAAQAYLSKWAKEYTVTQ